MMRLLNIGRILIYTTLLFSIFLVIQLLGFDDTNRDSQIRDKAHPKSTSTLENGRLEIRSGRTKDNAIARHNTALLLHPNTSSERHHCQTIHVAVVLVGSAQVRPFVHMLKTLLYFRQDKIALHVISDEAPRIILRKLLETWELPGFGAEYYTSSDTGSVADDLRTAYTRFHLQSILPDSINQVLVLDYRVRFVSDVRLLWNQFSAFSKKQIFGLTSVNTANNKRFFVDLLLLRLDRLRKNDVFDGNIKAVTSSWATVNTWFSEHPATVYNLSCSWLLRLESKANTQSCLQGGYPKALWWGPGAERHFTTDGPTERAKLYVTSVVEADGELMREFSSPCVDVNVIPMRAAQPCQEFRHAASLKRRTHLYFTGHYQTGDSASPYDITLVTQLTPDRFAVLEQLVQQWAGPLHAVFHLTEKEALHLPEMARRSSIIKSRRNIAFHAVYRRGIFNPINYLRNVGIEQVGTPYTLFMDVDLVPNKDLYSEIRKRIPKDMKEPGTTLVVPAFEALQPLSGFPETKDALLKLLKNKTVEGYRMSKGWNLGHKPTNYPKWITSTEPYLAKFRDAFEPYVVMETSSQPKYEEYLMERMGDKIAYVRRLYGMGFQFKVLPEHYVIHLPHAVSSGTNLWKSYPGYARCGSVLFEEFRKEMKRKYPNQKY